MCDEEFHEGDRVMFECRDGQVIRGRIYAANDDGTYNVRDEETLEPYARIFKEELSLLEDDCSSAVTFKKFNDKAINPSYYKDGEYECFNVAMARIREMKLPGMEAAMFFSVFKYLWRYKVKHADNPREDLEKAAWYLQNLIACVTDKAKA
nr:MAG TPA: nucelotide kinase [Caudoviricetes sp.]